MTTIEQCKATAETLSKLTGLNYKVMQGNGTTGLMVKFNNDYEWVLNGTNNKALNEAMWAIIKTIQWMK